MDREICWFYTSFVFGLWSNLNGKCVKLYGCPVNECPQHFITCTYPSFSPTYQCGLGKAIRFNVHAVYAVYGSLWLGNSPTLFEPRDDLRMVKKDRNWCRFPLFPARHSHIGHFCSFWSVAGHLISSSISTKCPSSVSDPM